MMNKILEKYCITIVIVIVVIIFLYLIFKENKENKENKKEFNFGKILDDRIDLRYIDKLLTDGECNHLINLSEGKFFKSGTVNGNNGYTNSEDRTSYSYYFGKSQDEIIKDIEKRVSELLNKNIKDIECLQIVRYLPGQQFKQHHDWFNEEYMKTINEQRQYTIFVYLNDVEGGGGETEFPKLNIKIKPKKGDAVFWKNCEDKYKCNDLSLHSGNPTKNSIKYGLNIWIRI